MSNDILKKIGKFLERNKGTIFTVLGAVGAVASVAEAIHATPKALQDLNEAVDEQEMLDNHEEFRNREIAPTMHPDEVVPIAKDEIGVKGIVKTCWKRYLPTALMTGASVSFILAGTGANARLNAAMAQALATVGSSLDIYQSQVVEVAGEEIAKQVDTAVAQKKLDKKPVEKQKKVPTAKPAVKQIGDGSMPQNEVVVSSGGYGVQLFYDALTGHYFRANGIEEVRRHQNDFNQMMIERSDWGTLNDWCDELGVTGCLFGDWLGWDCNHLLELRFSSMIASNGEACIVVDYNTNGPDDFIWFN